MKSENLKFQYRSATRKMYLWAVGLLLASCLIIVRIRMVEVLEEETLLAIGKLILACSVPLSLLIRLVFFVQPRIYSSYEISSTTLFKMRGRKRHEFPFSNISKIRISVFSPRFLGGFTITFKSGQVLTFLSALKDSHLILDAIIAHRPELVDADRFQQYMNQSRRVDISWKRLKEKISHWKMMSVKYLLTPLFLTGLSLFLGNSLGENYSATDNFSYQWMIFSVLIFFLGFLGDILGEKLVMNNIRWIEEKKAFMRNFAFERKTAHLMDGLFFAIAFGVGILLIGRG